MRIHSLSTYSFTVLFCFQSFTPILAAELTTEKIMITPIIGVHSMNHVRNGYGLKLYDYVVSGDSQFAESFNPLFDLFVRRFEIAVMSNWEYPKLAAMMGIIGTTTVRITFIDNGEIINVEMLKSSGELIFDKEILRTLHAVRKIDSHFPRGYRGKKFCLIVDFVYSNSRKQTIIIKQSSIE